MRIYVEKVMPRPFILERFLVPKSTQERKKVVLVSVPKSLRFLYRFFLDFSSILDPKGHLNIEHFSLNSALGVALGVSWRQEGPQSAPRGYQRPIFQEFCTILGYFFQKSYIVFSKKQHEIFKKRTNICL